MTIKKAMANASCTSLEKNRTLGLLRNDMVEINCRVIRMRLSESPVTQGIDKVQQEKVVLKRNHESYM